MPLVALFLLTLVLAPALRAAEEDNGLDDVTNDPYNPGPYEVPPGEEHDPNDGAGYTTRSFAHPGGTPSGVTYLIDGESGTTINPSNFGNAYGNPGGGSLSGGFSDAANRMQDILSGAGMGSGGEGLHRKVAIANAATMAQRDRVIQGGPTDQLIGISIGEPGRSLQFGGPIVNLDSPHDWRQGADQVSLLTKGNNLLGGVDNRLKRAADFLNKHTCGGFNWGAQFTQMFNEEALMNYLTNLAEGVAAAAPMTLVSALSPEVAEIIKWLKLNVGFDLTAEKNSCERIQAIMTNGLRKALWGNEYAQCMDGETDLRIANQKCSSADIGSLVQNDGTSYPVYASSPATATDNWRNDTFTTDLVGMNLEEMFEQSGAGADDPTRQSGMAALTGGALSISESTQLNTIQSGLSGGNTKKLLDVGSGDTLLQMARSLFGDIRVTAQGGIEAGRKSIQLFKLEVDTAIIPFRENFRAELDSHFAVLDQAAPPSGNTIQQSYEKLGAYTYHNRGAAKGVDPWKQDLIWLGDAARHHGNAQSAGTHRITDHTMDALAWLNHLSWTVGAKRPQMRSHIENTYAVTRVIDAMIKYEVYLYLLDQLHPAYTHLVTTAAKIPSTETEQKIFAERLVKQAEQAMREWENIVLEAESVVCKYLPVINEFRIPHSSSPAAANANRMPEHGFRQDEAPIRGD